MALLTWIGVTPTVYVFLTAVPAVFGTLGGYAAPGQALPGLASRRTLIGADL
jgi:hypothetical protein